MLSEIIIWLHVSCPDYVRSMGYLHQAIALRGRHKRRKTAWQPHLEKSCEFIAETAGRCRKRDKVVVLGSGLLLDVPLAILSQVFDEVVLVDIVHLPEVSKCITDYSNVRLVQADITGIAEKLFYGINGRRTQLPESDAFLPEANEGASLVISLNIISQLSIVPAEYIRKKTDACDEALIQAWCNRLRLGHFNVLRGLACDVCLIADYRYAYRSIKDNIIEQDTTVGDLELPAPQRSWTWDIAPRGEIGPKIAKELIVGAWHFAGSDSG